MGRPPFREQLKDIDRAIALYPDVAKHLQFHKEILQVREEIELNANKGTAVDWSVRSNVDKLQRRAESSKQPIISFLDKNTFVYTSILHLFEQITLKLIKQGLNEKGLAKLLDKVKASKTDLTDLIGAALIDDEKHFRREAKKLQLNTDIIHSIANTLIQPCLEEIARRVDSSFLEGWRKNHMSYMWKNTNHSLAQIA